jgi:CBS domain-containing protein
MSTPVITISPDTPVNECMRLMTEHRVRHLPVLDGGRVVGVVSIGDVIKYILTAQTETLHILSAYVATSSL